MIDSIYCFIQFILLFLNFLFLLENKRGTSLPGKDVIYRFLYHSGFAWRTFLHSLSLKVVLHFESLTSVKRVKVFIVDDSILNRNRSKKAELLARVFDHTAGRFAKVYNMLTLVWSDGFSFAPIDFMMLSSVKAVNRICEMTGSIQKRSQGYKRRMDAFIRKPDTVTVLIKRALKAGFKADYVLMDNWFTQAPLLQQLTAEGLSVIGMVKDMKHRYLWNGKRLTLRELYQTLPKNKKTTIWSSTIVQTACGLPVKLVFV